MRKILLNYSLLLIVWFFFFSCNGNSQQKKTADKVSFDSVFSPVDTIQIKEDSDNPIYSLYRFAIADSSLFLIDRKNYRILRYSKKGEFIQSWGQKGKGPKEFLNPVWIDFTPENKVFVIDSDGNFRVQIFNKNGTLLNTFPLRSSGPFLQSNFINRNGKILFITTTVANCLNNESHQCVIQIQDMKGNLVNSFANIETVSPNSIGLPFHSVLLEDESKIFIAHVYGKQLVSYSLEGKKLKEYSLTNSQSVHPLVTSTLPENVYAQAREMNNRSYTYIGEMYSSKNLIFIQYFRKGKKFKKTEYVSFIDVYNKKGTLIYTGINTKYQLMYVRNNSFYFLKKREGASNSTYTIFEYEFSK